MSQTIHSPPCTISLNTILNQFVQVYEWGIINRFNHQLDFIPMNSPLTHLYSLHGGIYSPPISNPIPPLPIRYIYYLPSLYYIYHQFPHLNTSPILKKTANLKLQMAANHVLNPS